MNKSSIKTWFKRNGFKPDGGSFRQNWQYCHKNGRHYRARYNSSTEAKIILRGVVVKDEPIGWVVDISDLDFDRWANSTEHNAVPFEEFISEYA